MIFGQQITIVVCRKRVLFYFWRMRNVIIGLVLYVLQLYFSFWGLPLFGKYGNPVVLFIISIAIPACYLYLRLTQPAYTGKPANGAGWWALGALSGFLLTYEELRKLFVQFADPRQYSDVLPQLETMYERFRDGIFPYAPVDMGGYAPYPVYMPLHWLPIGLADVTGIHDSRWVGYGALAIATAVMGYFTGKNGGSFRDKALAVLLPSFALWAFILWGTLEIPVSFELIIAAYYLVLAAGLYARNVTLVIPGLILCLLSRYTLAFWLPLFAWLAWQAMPRRQNYLIWGSVAVAVTAVYVLPFLLKDPGILKSGLAYHNQAAVDEWKGYGDPPVSWSFERGIYFAPHLKAMFSGDMEQRVLGARVVQGSLMLLLLGAGMVLYRKWRAKIDWYHFSLVFLYLFVCVFYFFGPLTYRYYLIVLYVLSAVLCAGIITAPLPETRREVA